MIAAVSHDAEIVPLHRALDVDAETVRSDDELMLIARSGQREAFDELVRRYQRRALAIAYKQLGDSALAKDAVQECFLEIFRYLPRYQARGRFAAFFYQVLLNQCRMAVRAAGSEQRRRDRLGEAVAADEGGAFSGGRSDQQLLQRERQRDVEHGLRQLSPKLRDVVVLRYAGDLPLLQIADSLGVPLGTVKSRLFSGVEQLRQILEADA